MPETERATAAVAICDLLDHDRDLLDMVEGHLLAEGLIEGVTPAEIAGVVDIHRETAANLFRQLEAADVATRTAYDAAVPESTFKFSGDGLRDIFDTAREAVAILAAYKERQPPETDVETLVTFPEDPAFGEVSPETFGMYQLLSALASEIKRASDSIILVAPFFEGSGFERLREVLASALERGVDITIVTRYLADHHSHNRSVIADFIEYLEEERDIRGQIRTVDYTVWEDSVPFSERTQEGAKPAFTLHAKVMVIDDSTAYVGSANVTDYGFDRFLELGVLLHGPAAEQYHTLFEFLLESEGATVVELG